MLLHCLILSWTIVRSYGNILRDSNLLLSSSKLFSDEILVTSLPDRLVIERLDDLVEFRTKDSKIQITKRKMSQGATNRALKMQCLGVYGVFTMPGGDCICLITNSTKCEGCIPNLFRITSVKLLRIPTPNSLNSAENDRLLALQQSAAENLLLSTFQRHSFYYCKGNYDITRSFQSNFRETDSSATDRDSRFYWNKNHVQCLLDANCSELVVPVTSAWISTSKNISFNNVSMQLTLISRRSRFRQGPRYIKRGSDLEGNVANFVETEQVLQRLDGQGDSSFIQIRGSIPLLWSQLERWKLKPKIKINDDFAGQVGVLRSHLADIAKHYGSSSRANLGEDYSKPFLYIVNLIDKKGSQGHLGRYLYAALSASTRRTPETYHSIINSNISASLKDRDIVSSDVFDGLLTNAGDENGDEGRRLKSKYIWFDYHRQCAEQATEARLRKIYEELKEVIDCEHTCQSALFLRLCRDSDSGEGERYIAAEQRHFIRTNCIDCLDRTNVVQAAISKWVLIKQIMALQTVEELANLETSSSLQESILQHTKQFENTLRKLWADNGDNLSLLYAGTKAMKRDVTRFGRRTAKGQLDDGMAFAKRYLINNCHDFIRQEGLDLIIGVDRNQQ